jgi:hypothetical protein
VLFDDIDISDFIGHLRPGDNLLAIHGLNTSLTSSDMLIGVRLDGAISTAAQEFTLAGAMELLAGLRVTELMYHAADGSDLDYIELQNISDTPLDLTGVRLGRGVDFVFGETTLEPGQYIVVVSDAASFRSTYGSGINIAGEYSGNLSNGGEEILLQLPQPLEAAILRFEYSDEWHRATDGDGKSLTIAEPLAHPATWSESENWRAAAPSPGK